MADIVLTGNTSGAITIAAPAAAGTNTITLPASTGTMALTSDIGGALTLLATANTTSGTSVSSGTLDLSSYKQVWTDMYSVGPAVNGGFLQFQPNGGTTTYYVDSSVSTTQAAYGFLHLDLATGVHHITRSEAQVPAQTVATNRLGGAAVMGINNGFTTSTTAILFSWTGGETFNAGTIKIYGLK